MNSRRLAASGLAVGVALIVALADIYSRRPPSTSASEPASPPVSTEHMADVASRFRNEQVDPSWSTRVGSRIDAALEDVQHTVDCRSRTCRVELQDDGTGRVSTHISNVARSVGDVLPSTSAQYVDQGNGRSVVALYLSSQPFDTPATSDRN